ncbi:MAG: sensor histidine kinase N-terminal domain-containing protein [Comamonas sp.]|uniref:sensor histidine kinase n=1 Tax=Comamonas sp. lk TaxID=2201272 RepID=UPI000EAE1B33|nr:sensor histidine kinase [Comamonas sp. lk]
MTANLRLRLLVLLLVPLVLLALMGGWFSYSSADAASTQHDQRLLRLLPALADSVLAPSIAEGTPPLVSLAPSVEDFLRGQGDEVGYAIGDLNGNVVAGDTWIKFDVPGTALAEFHSQEHDGVTYRVGVLKAETYGAGEMVVMLADSSDVRQQWVRQLLMHVLLPNLLLIAGAAVAIYWSVSRAFKPLHKLTQAVERRSPRDLSPIDETTSPEEVRPLVHSLNRLFSLVNAQAEGQRRFVADAAHQLRTPLAALQAQVEAWALSGQEAQRIAKRTGAEAQVVLSVAQIEQLRDATRRTSQLARQLLALSRADARNAEMQPIQKVELKDLCESMLELFIDSASNKGLDFGLEVEPVCVWGHSWLLRELVSNLVENAIKYTPEGGSVTLRCGQRQTPLGTDDSVLLGLPGVRGWAFVEVDDDGPGVPEAERSQITQRFYRAQGVVGEGTGLGLAIADEIAQLHQGALSFDEASSGKGLLVRLELPIQAPAESTDDGKVL